MNRPELEGSSEEERNKIDKALEAAFQEWLSKHDCVSVTLRVPREIYAVSQETSEHGVGSVIEALMLMHPLWVNLSGSPEGNKAGLPSMCSELAAESAMVFLRVLSGA